LYKLWLTEIEVYFRLWCLIGRKNKHRFWCIRHLRLILPSRVKLYLIYHWRTELCSWYVLVRNQTYTRSRDCLMVYYSYVSVRGYSFSALLLPLAMPLLRSMITYYCIFLEYFTSFDWPSLPFLERTALHLFLYLKIYFSHLPTVLLNLSLMSFSFRLWPSWLVGLEYTASFMIISR